jgi:integrase
MSKLRGQGEGTITQRRDGRWMARISLGWKDGKRRRKTLYGTTHEDVAKQLRAELVDRDRGKNIDVTTAPTFEEYATGWLETVKPTLKPSSWRFYDDHLRRNILLTLGTIRVTAICRRLVLHLVRGLRKRGFGTVTIRGIVRTLSACLSGAVDEQYLDSNPALNLRKYLRQGDHEKHEPDPLSVDDARQLVDTVRDQFPRWTAFILCGLRAGLRLSELIGLDWTDLDERAATLTIKRAFVRGQLVTPKNHQSRVVDVSPQLMRALLVYRRCAARVRATQRAAGADDHVSGRRRRRALGRLQRAKGLRAHLHRGEAALPLPA